MFIKLKKIRKMICEIKISRKFIVVYCFSVVFISCFNTILSFLTQLGLNKALDNAGGISLPFICVGLLFSCFIFILATYLSGVYKEKIFQCIAYALKSNTYYSYLKSPYLESSKINIGECLTYILG